MYRSVAVFDKTSDPGFMIADLRLDGIDVDKLIAIVPSREDDPGLIMCYTLSPTQLDAILALLPVTHSSLITIDHDTYEYSLEATA